MCGRFTQHHNTDDVIARFDVQHTLFSPTERYNIAPTQTLAVVLSDAVHHERYLEGFAWGLLPSWAKDTSMASKLINARAETITEKPAFRKSVENYRCIIPADGFYEWDKEGGTRQPFHFRLRTGELFGIAGIWSKWKEPEGTERFTCAIITTTANDLVGKIHDRMPVILQTRDDEQLWIDDTIHNPALVVPLLKTFPAEKMEAVAVDRRVGSPANDDPDLLEAVTA